MKKFATLILFSLLICASVSGANKYWYGHTSTDFAVASNWSTSNSSYVAASAIPGTSDVANFGNYTGMTTANCSLSANISVAGMTFTAGYTGTLTQSTYNITLGTTASTFSGGTFSGGSGSITVSAAFTISGCAFTSTSGTFSSSANFTVSSGSFTHNSGLVKFTATNTITGSVTFYQLEFAPSATATYTIASGTTLTVNNTLTISGSSAATLNTGAISAKGDVTLSNTSSSGGGSATVTINGTTTQTMTGASTSGNSRLPNVTINKSSDTLKLTNVITATGNWVYTAGVISAGSSTVLLTGTKTITGKHTLNKVTIAGGGTFTITSGDTLTVTDTLTIQGTIDITINTGVIAAKGDVKITNSATAGGGSATLLITGTANQTLTGPGTTAQGKLPNVVINKSSGTLTLSSLFTVAGNWTYTAGTISPGSSTVVFSGTKTISGSHTLANVNFAGGGTFTVSNTLTVTGTFTLQGTIATIINTGTIEAQGDITVTNSATGGGGTATLLIDGTGNQTLTGSGTGGQGNSPNITINKSSGTLTLSSTISVAGNWTYTAGTVSAGSSTVYFIGTKTISGTQTLNNVTFNTTALYTYTISSGVILTVTGTLTITGTVGVTINTGTIYVQGDFNYSNNITSGTGGSVAYVFNGTGNQTFTGATSGSGGRVGDVTINKSSGTLTLANTISVYGDWTLTAGTVDPGSSTINFAAIAKTISSASGAMSLYNVTFNGGVTYTLTGTSLTVLGTLFFAGSSVPTLSSGNVHAQGDITTTVSSTGTPGGTPITIDGTGNQILTGSGTAGQGRLPKITIDKTSGTLTLVSVISSNADWIYTRGTVIPGTSSIHFYGTFNLDGQESGTTNTMPFYDLTIAGSTRTLTGNLDVDRNLTINSSTTLSAGSNTITVGGNWSNSGTWTYSTSTVKFDGSGYKTISKSSGTETFYNLSLNRSSGSLTLSNPVTVNNTLTLTKGHLKTTSTNYLTLIDNATLSGGSDSAYVHGPMRKTGNDAFTFPLGDTLLNDTAYHPLAMTAPSSTSDQFEATYFAHKYTVGDSLVDSLVSVSQVENWKLERKVGSSNVTVTLGWNRNSALDNVSGLRVAGWNGTKWLDFGQAGLTVNWPTGVVGASVAVSFPANPIYITIGNTRSQNFGYATLQRKLDGCFYEAKSYALYFRLNDEYNDQTQHLSFRILNSANTDLASTLISSVNNTQLSYYGDNRFRLDLYNSTTHLSSGYYILEITNEKDEKFYLRFHIS